MPTDIHTKKSNNRTIFSNDYFPYITLPKLSKRKHEFLYTLKRKNLNTKELS